MKDAQFLFSKVKIPALKSVAEIVTHCISCFALWVKLNTYQLYQDMTHKAYTHILNSVRLQYFYDWILS